MVPALIEGEALSPDQAGLVGATNLGGYFLGALAAPWIRARWHEGRVIQTCLVLSVLCLIASIHPGGFLWLAFWRGFVGMTMAVLMILSISYVTRMAPPGRTGQATAIAFTGVGIGILLSSIALPWLLERGLSWAWSGTATVGGLVLCVGLWAWNAAPALAPPGRITTEIPRSALRAGILMVLAQGMFSIGLVPHSIYWSDYLVRSLGWSVADGGAQWILVGLGAIVGTLLWGRAADKIGFTRALVLIFISLSLSIALPVLWPSTATIVFSSLVFGAQPALSAVIASRAQQAIGDGPMVVLWRWMVIATGGGQIVAGYALVGMFNSNGDHVPVFLVGAAAMACGALLCTGLRSRPTAD